MSAAWFIVLEREIPEFDPFVNGKALAKAGKELERLAKDAGVKPLMEFFSVSADEMGGIGEEFGLDLRARSRMPADQWFSPEEGLRSVLALLEAAEKRGGSERMANDLKEFQKVLEVAKENGVRWHLAVDF